MHLRTGYCVGQAIRYSRSDAGVVPVFAMQSGDVLQKVVVQARGEDNQ
jgi:hypothetical protein